MSIRNNEKTEADKTAKQMCDTYKKERSINTDSQAYHQLMCDGVEYRKKYFEEVERRKELERKHDELMKKIQAYKQSHNGLINQEIEYIQEEDYCHYCESVL